MLRIALCLCALATLGNCQLVGYADVGNFSCNKVAELVTRTDMTGVVKSPCYDGDSTIYPQELNAGLKLTNISYDSPYVYGYRLIIKDFQLWQFDRLFIGDLTEITGNNFKAIRNFTLFSNDTTNRVFYLQQGDDGDVIDTLHLDTDNIVTLNNFNKVILDFYTIEDSGQGRGYLIEYETDINKCLFTGVDLYCKNSGICARTGFNTAGCDCTGTGYTGGICAIDVDECPTGVNTHLCALTGTCVNKVGGYGCTCNTGYEGGTDGPCTDIDECPTGVNTHLCALTGLCSNKAGGYDCICSAGYENGIGGPCDDINECSVGTASCDGNADCTNTIGSYRCDCSAGYTGDGLTCADIDECPTGVNTHLCALTGLCSNKAGGYDCICNSGYEDGIGGPCDDIDECPTGVNTHLCAATGTCLNKAGGYDCTCNSGYSGGTGGPCIDIDECPTGVNTHLCAATGTCLNKVGGYDCTCNEGYEGGTGGPCTDIDECPTGVNTHLCAATGTCLNKAGGYDCTCNSGYEGGTGGPCIDIDECPTGVNTHLCAATGTCLNKAGGYDCTCNEGYEGGIGGPCTNIGECARDADDCDENAICTDTVGSFTCACDEFYTGDGKTCIDIDECAGDTDPCAPTGTCSNKVGGFDCTCFEGWFGGIGGPCDDVDECATDADDCDVEAEAICTNTVGSFTCACRDGYTGDGKACEDIDECANDDLNTCNKDLATCANIAGSYTCTCITGYAGDGRTCTNIDECTVGGHDCHANADCTDTIGRWRCACKVGFTGDGVNCADNDECATGEHNCDTNAGCFNNPGSFTCGCNAGYTGNGASCTDINECLETPPRCDVNAGCTNLPGTFTCACNPGYTGNGATCTDIDECALNTDNCHANAGCTNIGGSFNCACNNGYTGNGVTCIDDDECTSKTDNCDAVNAICDNSPGSFTCACRTGWSGNGVTCVDINECETSADTCVAPESTCKNTVGSFDCICNEPVWRGTPGNCEYYCDHNTTCIQNQNGYIDVPLYNDGSKTYQAFDETFWNFQASTTGAGIRFTFKRFSTEIKDDFLSIYPGSAVDVPNEIVGLSGTIQNLWNEEDRVTNSGDIHRGGSSVTADIDLSSAEATLTLSSSDLYVAFTSDRLNTSIGFLLYFEYDLNDCPSPSTCENGGTCQDRAFEYQCINCPGYIGRDCEIDDDECLVSTSCHTNADCTNTIGSFNCECKQFYVGDGKVACNPEIVLSGFNVVEKTTSSLSVNFDITAMWKNTDYLVTFEITINKVSAVFSKTYSVNLTTLIEGPLVITGLETYTEYEITVRVSTRGALFGTSVIVNNVASQRVFTAESNAGLPTNFAVGRITRDRVEFSWAAPVEAGFGVVKHYEICYIPASDDKTQLTASLRGISTEISCVYLDDTYSSYTWVGVPSYITLDFKMEAYSSVGPSGYTTPLSVYPKSNICLEWKDFASRATCAIDTTKGLQGLLLSKGFPQETTTSDNNIIRQEWSFDVSSYDGWRPYFFYFNIVNLESTVDFGYGNDINPEIHDLEKEAQTGSYTGEMAIGPGATVTRDTSKPDESLLWMTYISDRTRKRPGFQVEIELDGNNCLSTPCLHGGICTDGSYTYTCDCSATHWTGTNCEIPKVNPTVSCTTGKRDAEFTFDVQAQWRGDETVIGGYTIQLTKPDSTTEAMTKTFEDAKSGTFTGLTPYSEYKITVTVSSSIREVVTYNIGEIICTTQEDAPTAPRNVNVEPAMKSLEVTWEAPAEPNGVVSYVVTFASTNHGEYSEALQTGSSSDLTATSYTISGLRDYRAYTVSVRAKTSGGFTDAEAVSEMTSPGAPSAFALVNITVIPNRSARVQWTFVDSVFVGPVTVAISAVSTVHAAETVIVESGATPYVYDKLEEGQVYNFTLTASTGTDPDQVYMKTGVDTASVAPGVPATFTYDPETSTFEWSAPSVLEQNGVITGYVLKAITTVPGFTQQIFEATDSSFQLTGLPAYTFYNFSLQAINGAGEGLESIINIRTKEEVPETPASVTPSEITDTSITISWPAQEPAVGNVVYVITYSDGVTTEELETADTSTTLTGLKPYTNYTITVVAKSNAGSADPIEVSFKTAEGTPSAPQNLAATFSISEYQIAVTWSAPSEENGVLSKYTVTWTAAGGTPDSVDVELPATSYTIPSVTLSETEYTVQVTATTGAGEGAEASLTVTTPVLRLNPPQNPVASGETSTTVTINANEPDNAASLGITGYVVIISQDPQDCAKYSGESCLSNDRSNTPTTLPFTITGLKAYRLYIITVAAKSAAGESEASESVTVRTGSGAPNTPNVTSVTGISGGVTVQFNAGTPFTGPAEYTITATGEGVPNITVVVSETEEHESITDNLVGLDGNTTYQISVIAVNSEGSSSASESQSVTTPAATVAIERTSSSLTGTITDAGAASNAEYVYSYFAADCDDNCTTEQIPVSDKKFVISGLIPYTVYNVTVYASFGTNPGLSIKSSQRTRAGQPTLIDVDFLVPQSNETADGFRAWNNVELVNLCLTKAAVFDEIHGPILFMAYIVRQKGATGNVSLKTYYDQANNQDPSPPYRSITVTCTTTSRRKRSSHGGVTIGTDTCQDGVNEECNGPLKPETTYNFQACGLNEENNYVCTQPGEDITTAPAPVSRGLTAGEIAAIVICSILLLILIILLIVYIVKRRRHRTGKHSVSRTGRANPTFESKASQQKYQVDPTAEPKTDYSVPTA